MHRTFPDFRAPAAGSRDRESGEAAADRSAPSPEADDGGLRQERLQAVPSRSAERTISGSLPTFFLVLPDFSLFMPGEFVLCNSLAMYQR